MKRPSLRRASAWALAAGMAGLVGIQFVPVQKTNPPVRTEIDAPPAVLEILQRSCYDCHSNETRWPWYSRIAPMSWGMASHVRRGRGDLNFSDWPVFDFQLQESNLHDIHEQIRKGKMPLRSYLWLHSDARLSQEDRQVLLDWTGTAAAEDVEP